MMTKDASKFDDIKNLSFEESMAELEQIVRKLEEGKAALDDSINFYERGAALQQHCEAKLREAEMRVEKITLKPDGNVEATPIDA